MNFDIIWLFLIISASIQFLILLRIIVDLLPVKYNNSLFKFIFESSESFLKPLKKIVKFPLIGYINLAPLFAFLIILIVQLIIVYTKNLPL